MKRISNKNAMNSVINRAAFKGNNLNAEYVNGVYFVFSYEWYPIYMYSNGAFFKNTDYYSATTQRHIRNCYPYSCNIIESDASQLKEFYKMAKYKLFKELYEIVEREFYKAQAIALQSNKTTKS